MKVLFIGGVFAPENEEEVIKSSRANVEFSANVFQKKLINGFKHNNIDMDVVSAPFIGSYPIASDIMFFKDFEKSQDLCRYVSFNNVWGLRNFSRAAALKKEIRDFIDNKDSEKLIIVYSPHTPFLEAAAYAKKKDSSIKVCIVIPDLPQYMNLKSNISFMYKFAKYFDIKKFNKLNSCVDSYILLTEKMKEKIPMGNKPYAVVEGVVDSKKLEEQQCNVEAGEEKERETKNIVYTGKLAERFGAKNLVDAFQKVKGDNLRLIICGKGDAESYVEEKAKNDTRIQYMGQVTPQQAQEFVDNADVLVNPREDNEEYTKYSFPSKNIEYLISGKPVVAYLLSGMPECYRDYIYCADDGLVHAIESALNDNKENQQYKYKLACEHLKTLTGEAIADIIINVSFKDVHRQ